MKDVLYKRRRPSNFKEVVGQDAAIDTLKGFGKRKSVPRFLGLWGPSGTGKTTLFRILATKLGCGPADLVEVNAANNNGIDMVRDIESRCRMQPLGGRVRVWIIDECHQLTKPAQNAFLKLLEDTPAHVHFFFATTDPQKLLPTVRSRATEVVLKAVPDGVIEKHLTAMAAMEGWTVSKDVVEAIAEAACGGVRKAMVLLDQVSTIDGEEAQLAAITAADEKVVAFQLCRLLTAKKISWPSVGKMLKEITEEPEGIRYMVMGYANAILCKRANARAALIIDSFQYNFYDSKKAGLTLACWRVYEAAT